MDQERDADVVTDTERHAMNLALAAYRRGSAKTLRELLSFGLTGQVRPDDEIARYVRENYTVEWVAENLPQVAAAREASRPGQ